MREPLDASLPATESLGAVGIVGGAGHVGLPLGLSFAAAGRQVVLFDVNEAAIARLRDGQMPFMEEGGAELLRAHVGRRLTLSPDPSCLTDVDNVICIVGTPIDEHLNPQVDHLLQTVGKIEAHLRPTQLFVLRSTVFPGATETIDRHLQRVVPGIDVAFCPERVAQGYSIREIGKMPQIISGVHERALSRARVLFQTICPSTIDLKPMEAELAKLFCNAWRYITFAVANQFYTVCAENGIDYYAIWEAITRDYPRMQGLPKAGFAAGPCLFKDTMQLASFFANDFPLGHSAMLVNEQLPRKIVRLLNQQLPLRDKTVAVLGMAFKGDIDDMRESLAFKLRKLLLVECQEVLCTDEYARLPWFVPLEEALARADAVIIAAPHSRYRSLDLDKPFVDPWNILGKGGLVNL
jgi:UDP-N-acetyl-D-mannosaminuronic acid dehydrogenase